MAEWLYKATNSKLDLTGTDILAQKCGFLCRSARSRKRDAWIANVRKVRFDDLIHFYFREKNRPLTPLGTFQVIKKDDHPAPDRLGSLVDETALYEVTSEDFIKRCDPHGAYEHDPVARCFTGWAIKRIGDAPAPEPSFAQGQPTMVPRFANVEVAYALEPDEEEDDIE